MIANTIILEGGFSNRANDRGGPTNWGITIKTLSRWLGREATIDDVKNLKKDTAVEIYQKYYIDEPHINLITDENLRVLLFDTGVNNGPVTAIRLLQHSIGAKPDGVLGAVTLGTIRAFKNPSEVRERFLNARQAYDNNIVAKDPSQLANKHGWDNRIALLRKEYV